MKVTRNDPCPCGSGRKYKHCCLKRKSKGPSIEAIRPEDLNILGEVDYIIKSAESGDSRLVGLGQFILFSTEGRDAWILDPRENLALCLVEGGQRQQFNIVENSKQFSIEWTGNYRLENDTFFYLPEPGKISMRFDYPVEEIANFSRKDDSGVMH